MLKKLILKIGKLPIRTQWLVVALEIAIVVALLYFSQGAINAY